MVFPVILDLIPALFISDFISDSPSVATDPRRWATGDHRKNRSVTATEVAPDGTVVEDRWPRMDLPGLSTRVTS